MALTTFYYSDNPPTTSSATTITVATYLTDKNLISVDIGSGVNAIAFAFPDRTGLASVTLPNTLLTIAFNAFNGCTSLPSINIPSGVVSIGGTAFNNCTSLASINVDASNLYYSSDIDGTLYNKDKTSILRYPIGKAAPFYTIDSNVTSIGYAAFQGSLNLSTITIPSSVTSIDQSAFEKCTGLINQIIPESVTSIGEAAFASCSNLNNINIPNNLTNIPQRMFSSCTALNNITIPDNVAIIGNDAFRLCSSLTSIIIPNNVSYIGNFAFSNCTSLASITISNTVNFIGRYAFFSCTSLTSVILPSQLTSIQERLFNNCSNLISVSIPNGVTSIGEEAFRSCSNLSSLTMPQSLLTISRFAFAFSPNLIRINFLGDAPPNVVFDAFSSSALALKLYRKKNFVTGWTSTLQGRPVVLWSDNVIKDGGAGKLTTKNRYLYIVAGAQVPSNMNVRFYDSTQRTVSTQQPIYYDENNQYQLRYVGDGWKIFSITLSDVYGAFYRFDASEPPNPLGGGYDGRNGWIGTVTISEYLK
jgi:hypothetical protein